MSKGILRIQSAISSGQAANKQLTNADKDIAIVGMACRFANGLSVSDFWKVLSEAKHVGGGISQERKADIDRFIRSKGNYYWGNYCWGSFFDNIASFDYTLFGLSPKEAALIDPNHRFFLQEVWHLFEDAGYQQASLKGRDVGVFVGQSQDFGQPYRNVIHANDLQAIPLALAGNVNSGIAGRVAYSFDLKGPAVTIDTACSSSLVAVLEACRYLQREDGEMAIAGGVKLHPIPVHSDNKDGLGYQSLPGILAADGKTKAFDDQANGIGIGEGVGVIMLKTVRQALRDGDKIHAVIKGGAINQDGASAGMTAPNGEAQTALLLKAWKDAGVTPDSISYIEAHGTGTPLGDPVEINALCAAFRMQTSKKQFCGIGSVKTNIGHLDNVAGLSGLIKVVLALQKQEIPATLFFNRENRFVDLISSPLFVASKATPWKSDALPRRAGVSAFGLSGTNCHLVLEEAPETADTFPTSDRIQYMLAFSAGSFSALKTLIEDYKRFVAENHNFSAYDLCSNAALGREHLSARIAIIFHDQAELDQKLQSIMLLPDDIQGDVLFGMHQLVSDLQQVRTGREISFSEKALLDEEVKTLIQTEDLIDNMKLLAQYYIKGADIPWSRLFDDPYQKVTLPLYPFERLRCWVDPVENSQEDFRFISCPNHPLIDECINHQSGDVLYHTQIRVEKHWEVRDHLVYGNHVLPGTAFLDMLFYLVKNVPFLADRKSLQNVMFVKPLTLKGSEEKDIYIRAFKEEDVYKFNIYGVGADGDDLMVQGELHQEVAFENGRDAVPALNRLIERFESAPLLPAAQEDGAVSTGDRWHCVERISGLDGAYFIRLSLLEKYKAEADQYSYHPALLDCAANAVNHLLTGHVYLPFSYKSITFFKALGSEAYSYITCQSVSEEVAVLDIVLYNSAGERSVLISGYTIKRVRKDAFAESRQFLHDLYSMETVRTAVTESIPTVDFGGKRILHITGSQELTEQFRLHKGFVTEVIWGEAFCREGDRFTVNGLADFDLLFKETGTVFDYVICSTSFIHPSEKFNLKLQDRKAYCDNSFVLVQALLKNKIKVNFNIVWVTSKGIATQSQEVLNPWSTAAISFVRTVNAEYENLNILLIDLDETVNFDFLFGQLRAMDKGIVALRGNEKYEPLLKPLHLDPSIEVGPLIKKGSVVLISGGLGAIGLRIALYLAEAEPSLTLILIGRSGFPPNNEWEQIVRSETNVKLSEKIKILQRIAKLGAQVSLCNADVSNREQLAATLNETRANHGKISGIIHAAGVAGDGFLIRKEQDTIDSVLRPKIDGTILLHQLTEDDELDFFVLFSSVNALYGEAGQSDYAAANGFLDGFARYRSGLGRHTVSINWPAWADIGMAVDYGTPQNGVIKSIHSDLAVHLLGLALKTKHSQYSLLQWNQSKLLHHEQLRQLLPESYRQKLLYPITPIANDVISNPTVKLTGKPIADITDEERFIGSVWQRVLGMEEMNVHDSFYSLGGNSISATMAFKDLSLQYPDYIEVADMFTYTTIESLGAYLTGQLRPSKPLEDASDELDDLFRKLSSGEITVDEANSKLK